MAQLTYPTDLAVAFPGMLADLSPRNDTLSRQFENATASPAGLAVVRGTDLDNQVDLPSAAADIVGVMLHSHAANVDDNDQNLISQDQTVNVLHAGRVYVSVEEAVTPASTVFVRVSGGQAGAFRASDPGASAALAMTGARYLTSAGANELAVLEIDAGASIA